MKTPMGGECLFCQSFLKKLPNLSAEEVQKMTEAIAIKYPHQAKIILNTLLKNQET